MKKIIFLVLVFVFMASQAFALIEDNRNVLSNRLLLLINKCGQVRMTVEAYDAAGKITTLTSTQKAAILSDINAMAGDIQTLFNSAKDVFTATEPIIEDIPDDI